MGVYIAKPFVAATPQAEVIGQTVQAFTSHLEADVIMPLLPKHGLHRVDPQGWYPHQNWMDILREVWQTPGGEMALVALGKQIARTADMPPEIESIPGALHLLHTIHHVNLRHVPVEEGYVIKPMGEQHCLVYHNTPDPVDIIYGLIWGLVARFRQADEQFVVRQIANPTPDETPGTVFEIRWGSAA